MLFSKTQSLIAALAMTSSVSAHTTFTNFFVNGQDQGDAIAIRMRKDNGAGTAGDPLDNLSSTDLACGFDGTQGLPRVAAVPDGATLTFEFHSWAGDKSKPSLDPGHLGPCAVYAKKVDSAVSDSGAGDGWFKLWDEGYDAAAGKWCTTKLIENGGVLSVALPKNLLGGNYLVRPELLALHQALDGNPQFYAGCAQIFLESSGDLGPSETVSIPGYVNAGDANMNWNIYYGQDNAKYPQVGPKVATLVSGGAGKSAQTSQTEGFKPAGCILESGSDWCGIEVPSYTDEKGCWASTENCWNQNKDCWAKAPATGGNCKIWEQKCEAISSTCSSGNWNGPPNKGQDLTPSKGTINVGGLQPTNGGGVVEGGAAQTPAPVASSKVADAPVATEPTSAPAAPVEEESDDSAYTPAPAPTTTRRRKGGKGKSRPTQVVQQGGDAPATTPAPVAEEYGNGSIKWVTVYTTTEVTEIEYKTIDVYNKHKRMHGRRLRAPHGGMS